MRVIQNIVIGATVIFIGFVMYPLYIDNMYTPLYDMLSAAFPSLPTEADFFMRFMPYVILFSIVGCGIMWIMGKRHLPGGGDTGAKTEGK
jgi:hypothetical protein